jgi:hypothetical protein
MTKGHDWHKGIRRWVINSDFVIRASSFAANRMEKNIASSRIFFLANGPGMATKRAA